MPWFMTIETSTLKGGGGGGFNCASSIDCRYRGLRFAWDHGGLPGSDPVVLCGGVRDGFSRIQAHVPLNIMIQIT